MKQRLSINKKITDVKSSNPSINLLNSKDMTKDFLVTILFSNKSGQILKSIQIEAENYSEALTIASIGAVATKHHNCKHFVRTQAVIIDKEHMYYIMFGGKGQHIFKPFANLSCASKKPLRSLNAFYYMCQMSSQSFIELVRVELPQATRIEVLFKSLSDFLNICTNGSTEIKTTFSQAPLRA